MPADKVLTLWERLFAVYEEISYVNKDMELQLKSGKSYQVSSETEVLKQVRPVLLKHHLIIMQTGAVGTKIGHISSVNVTYRIICVDTGECMDLGSYGEGSDTQDKGAGMALTYALKNLLKKTFLLISGEDPDAKTSETTDAELSAADQAYNAVVIRLGELVKTSKMNQEDNALWHSSINKPDVRHAVNRLQDALAALDKKYPREQKPAAQPVQQPAKQAAPAAQPVQQAAPAPQQPAPVQQTRNDEPPQDAGSGGETRELDIF